MEPPSKPTQFNSTVGRNAKWSLVQTFVSAITVFVLYKYLYNHFGPEQLGLWAVVLASVSLGKLAELGFSTTVLRYVSQHLAKGDRTRAANILETGLISVSLPFLLALLALYPLLEIIVSFFVPSAAMSEALQILPYAIGTLWFGVIGSIAQSGLDGCGRMDVKSKILIVGNLFYVPAGIAFSQYWGIAGLAAGQLFQSIFITGFVWIALRRELPTLNWLPTSWNFDCFKETIRYAAGLQLGNLLILLFEPATKMLLSRYCGLTDVAHFEMANQVVSRVRALITSAMQAYLPLLSATAAENIDGTRRVIAEAFTFVTGLGVPLMAALVVAYPVISIIWLGAIEPNFVAYGWILGTGWLIATLAMPTYFYCVGAGRIGTILSSQALRVILNTVLGFGAALYGLGYWIAASMMLSLVAENMVTARRALSDLGVHFTEALQHKGVKKGISSIVLVLFILAIDISASIKTGMDKHAFAIFLVHTFALLLVAYFSTACGELIARYRRPQ